jgi:hypothetical protein
VRDVTFGEDHSQVRTDHGPTNLAALRTPAINPLRLTGHTNIAPGLRQHARTPLLPLVTLGLSQRLCRGPGGRAPSPRLSRTLRVVPGRRRWPTHRPRTPDVHSDVRGPEVGDRRLHRPRQWPSWDATGAALAAALLRSRQKAPASPVWDAGSFVRVYGLRAGRLPR